MKFTRFSLVIRSIIINYFVKISHCRYRCTKVKMVRLESGAERLKFDNHLSGFLPSFLSALSLTPSRISNSVFAPFLPSSVLRLAHMSFRRERERPWRTFTKILPFPNFRRSFLLPHGGFARMQLCSKFGENTLGITIGKSKIEVVERCDFFST